MSEAQKPVLVFSAFYPPAFLGGGPIRTLSATVKAAPSEFAPTVVTSDTDLGESLPLPVQRNMIIQSNGASVRYVSVKSPKSVIRAIRSFRRIKPEIVYLNSFFDFRFSIIPQILASVGYLSPRVIGLAPRGEFSTAALLLKQRKKRFFLRLYRFSGMLRRVVWHASSEFEAADIRRVMGPSSRVIIRENDSDLPSRAIPFCVTPDQALRIVFVGRIVPIKGLRTLLEALKGCSAPLSLDVYGPEEDAVYTQTCKRIAGELPRNVTVNFIGAVPNEVVRDSLPQYDLMTFPTLGENFGHVIAEALAASCPVMCADVTPWTSRLAEGGGQIVESNTVAGWASALGEYTLRSLESRAAARKAAGRCFEQWRNESNKPHIFTLLSQAQLPTESVTTSK